MKFQDSIKVCLTQKYAEFHGEATRSEYWWFALFVLLGGVVCSSLSRSLGGVFYLAVLLPNIAVATRRLHDAGRSGWWQLIGLVPLVGWVVLIVFLTQSGKTPPTPI